MRVGSGWRLPAVAEDYTGHDMTDFAQEFLRRDPDYRNDYHLTKARIAMARLDAQTEMEGLARRWSMGFPCAPDAHVADAPALWLPEISAATVIIGAAPLSRVEPAPFDFAQIGEILSDHLTSTGRHIIITDAGRKHRIWMHGGGNEAELAFIIPADSGFAFRMAATQRVERRLRGFPAGAEAADLGPTAFQRQRLALLLRLIDADQANATRREMAFTLIYPHHKPLVGDVWKGSAERRRTQRLIDDAIKLMRGGYRALLQG